MTQQISLVSDGYLPPDGSGVVVDIEHLPDMMAVCVATGRGDIVLWNTSSGEVGNSLYYSPFLRQVFAK